jgi:ferrous iron transport protein B
MKQTSSPTIVLAGNPNCGKTALFNALTGSRQKVGNWPGVTVEKKTGLMKIQDNTISIVDLPGIYSLSVLSEEGAIDERIACEYLLTEEPKLIVNVVDAANLERNLYLTIQLLEMRLPMILAVNMMDVLNQRGMKIALDKLSALLDCPVVGLIANQAKGIAELQTAILNMRKQSHISQVQCNYSPEIQQVITEVAKSFDNNQWLAIRSIEGNHLANTLSHSAKFSEDADILIADARYGWSQQITATVLKKNLTNTSKLQGEPWLDRIVLNRYLGIPIFLLVMYAMFVFSINVAGAFQDFFEKSSDAIFVTGVDHLLSHLHAPTWVIALVAHGIGKGINTTITFTPILAGMFLFLAFLEDSGYMARAAFVMDRCMQALGLPGKSFIPMIVGFGCNVPAIMGSRTIAHPRDRILTVMMMPFMSCSARLAIFAVFVAAFFPSWGAEIIFLLYVLGIAIAILTGVLLRKTVLKGEPSPFVMEFPSYHVPHFRSIFRQMWHRLKSFLFRAGKVIIPVCMLIGVLNSVSPGGQLTEGGEQSILAKTGRILTPILQPMGIQTSNWPATVGLLTGVLAKEVVIGTLNTLYSKPNLDDTHTTVIDGLRDALLSIPNNLSGMGAALQNPFKASESPHAMDQKSYGVMSHQFGSQASAFAYLLFVLLYFPCISTLAAMRREIGKGWANLSMVWSMMLAYGFAVMSYQILTYSSHATRSLVWIISIVMIFFITVLGFRSWPDIVNRRRAGP